MMELRRITIIGLVVSLATSQTKTIPEGWSLNGLGLSESERKDY